MKTLMLCKLLFLPSFFLFQQVFNLETTRRLTSTFTCVAGFAAHGEVDVTLLCGLLHQLHNQLVRLAHHRCAVDAYQFITGSQASILVCSSVFDDVSDVDLKHIELG